MEYIPGARTLTEYAQYKKLGTRERLLLFSKVCDAVHHGHQKGIIHRDLKPSNILVDSSGEPKIIDFGVARATDSDLAVTTLQTDIGQLIGTLQYMSPEQCEADPDDIDTRSDVYALGVVMYELLCGQLPYDVSRAAVFATRVIREAEPVKPSTCDRTLRGDAETITLKALEKDRSRRYQSAVELGQDIVRYLRSEVIEARPPSATYRLRKFLKRNSREVIFGVILFAVVIAGAAGFAWQRADAQGRARLADLARQETQRNEGQAAASIRIMNLLVGEELGTVALPNGGGGVAVVPTGINSSTTDELMRRCIESQGLAAIGDYQGAIDGFESLLVDINALEEPDSPVAEVIRLTASDFMADSLIATGQHETALPLAYRVMRFVSERRGEDDPGALWHIQRMQVILNAMNDPRADVLAERGIEFTLEPSAVSFAKREFLGLAGSEFALLVTADGIVTKVNLDSLKETQTEWTLHDYVSASISPDGAHIAYVTEDSDLVIRRTDDWTETDRQHAFKSRPCFVGTTSLVLLEDADWDSMRALDLESGRGAQVWELTTDGTLMRDETPALPFVVSPPRGSIGITDKVIATEGFEFASDGSVMRGVAVIDFSSNDFALIDTASVLSCAVAPDGGQLAVGRGSQDLELWDITSGELTARCEGHSNWVVALAFSSCGRFLVSGAGDGTVRIWHSGTGDHLKVLDVGYSNLYCWRVELTEDDSLLFVESEDGVGVWKNPLP